VQALRSDYAAGSFSPIAIRKERVRAARSQPADECLTLRGVLMAGAPSLMPFKGGVLGLISYARMSQNPILFLF
jgi:hypothetical protein